MCIAATSIHKVQKRINTCLARGLTGCSDLFVVAYVGACSRARKEFLILNKFCMKPLAYARTGHHSRAYPRAREVQGTMTFSSLVKTTTSNEANFLLTLNFIPDNRDAGAQQ